MRNEARKAFRTSRRAVALVMAAVLCLSTLVTAAPAEAAGFTKPKLAAKKKTLYYNKKSKKTYTLKVKSNKVKKIVKTTWKTSKKSVVSISKKKKMSVKLTAKKKGTATVTATIRYVPKGMWMVRTLNLKCKVTSKRASSSTVTPPAGKVTPKPVPKPSTKPGNSPNPPQGNEGQKPAKVVLDQDEALFSSTEEGENTKELTAVVKDAQGKEIKDQDITWSTDNDKIAAVEDGVITAKKEGRANITASAGNITSEPCTVIVDTTPPAVEGAKITDYKTIRVYFDETVTGEPEVSVTRSAEDAEDVPVRMTPVLSEDGQSLILTSAAALKEGTYDLEMAGLTDYVGNSLSNNRKTVIKSASVPDKFICRTEEIPAGQDEVMVYFRVTDQYGEELRNYRIDDLKATAETESGMPLEVSVVEGKDCVKITGAIAMLAEGKRVVITLSSKKLGVSGEFTTVLVDPEGVGKAAKIDRVIAESKDMANSGDSEAPQFALTTDEKLNVFTLSAELLDRFGSPANSRVVYSINDSSGIIEFVNTEGSNSKDTNICDSDKAVTVRARKKGVVTITVYLASDDSQRRDITITIRPTALKRITVGELASGYNMQESQAKITLDPIGTGITAKDLTYEALDDRSAERIEKIQFSDAEDGSEEIYVSVTAKADSKDDPIHFIVYCMEDGQKIGTSNAVTYLSSPMPLVDKIKVDAFEETICCFKEVKTSYRLLNRYGENITNIAEGGLDVEVSAGGIGKVSDISAEEGILAVTGQSPGKITITLKYENISETILEEVYDTATVKTVMIDTARADGKSWELVQENTEKVIIPVSFKDQYKNKITVKFDDWEDYLPEAIVNGALKDNNSGGIQNISSEYISINPVDLSGDALVRGDIVEAVALQCNKNAPNAPTKPNSQIFKFSFANSGVEGFSCNTVSVYLRPERTPSKLVFEESSIVAMSEANYTQKVTVLDQYGDEWGAASPSVTYKVFDKDGMDHSADVDLTNPSNIELRPSLSAGTYTVFAYITKAGSPIPSTPADISKLVHASYTLKVGNVKDLAQSIQICETIVDKGTGNQKTISDVDYIMITNSDPGNSQAEWQLDYKLYDKDGLEIAKPSGPNGYGILPGELGWSVSGSNIAVSIKDGLMKAQFEGTADTGIIMVELSYEPGGIRKGSLAIPVSSKNPVIKSGTYKIQKTSSGADVDLTEVQDLESPDVTYSIKGIDQYGDQIAAGALYSVYAKDKSVATVTKETAVGHLHEFKVKQTTGATIGQETVVIVKPTEKEKALEMKVKVPAAAP